MTNSTRFPVAQRDGFLIPSGPDLSLDEYHFFIVISDPAKHEDVLMVNMSTVHEGVQHDATCYLLVGYHPFIRHTSYIVYAKTRIIPITRLQSLIAARTIIFRPPPVSAAVYAKIAEGVGSAQMMPAHTDFFNRYK
jgi:hypothetical protein